LSKRRDSAKTLHSLYTRLYRYFGPQYWWPAHTGFEVIVGAILTQNTAWSNVEKAITSLRNEGLLKPSALKKVTRKRLAAFIRPSGYYNLKAERLKNFVYFLYTRYGGSLKKMFSQPLFQLRSELLGVKGLGAETVDSILLYAAKKPIFVVDAYTRRILLRHKLIKEKNTYQDIQQMFMDNLCADSTYFGEYHALLVRLAKEYCRTRPQCERCPIKGL